MKISSFPWGFAIVCCLMVCYQGRAQGNVRVDKFAFASPSGNFLQCTCSVGGDGALHANNRKVNKEETWWMWTLGDPKNHQVALQNYRNNYYMWRHGGGGTNHRARMIHDMTGESAWTMISGTDYGLPAEYVAFRAYDNAYLKAWQGGGHGDAPGEGAEVYVDNDGPTKDIHWVGWWHMGAVTFDPQDGANTLTSIGDGFYAAIVWTGNAIACPWTHGSPSSQNSTTQTPVLACSALPAPVRTGTDNYLHAYCEDADYLGPYYSQNEAYASRRVQCDIDAFHKTDPRTACVPLVCSQGSTPTRGCAGVP